MGFGVRVRVGVRARVRVRYGCLSCLIELLRCRWQRVMGVAGSTSRLR